MNKTEARSLVPMVRRRKEEVLSELAIRQTTFLKEAKQIIKTEKEDEIVKFKAKLEAFEAKKRELYEEGLQLAEEIHEAKLTSNDYPTNWDRNYNRRKLVLMDKPVSDIRVFVDFDKTENSLTTQVGERVRIAKKEIERHFNTLLDQLTLNMVDSEDAKDFYHNLPSVDAFLPLPNGTPLKELLASSDE